MRLPQTTSEYITSPSAICWLDGGFLKSDPPKEALLALCFKSPWRAFSLFRTSERKAFEAGIWTSLVTDPGSLVVDTKMLSVLHGQNQGHHIVFVTRLPGNVAVPLIEEAGFDRFSVIHPDDLSADHKALPNLSVNLLKPAAFPIRALIRSLRPHQWVKNLLIFLPLVTGHRVNWHLWAVACAAALALSICASSVYVLNDLLDLSSDRRHSTKKRRPFASADLLVSVGLFTAPLLLITAILMAFFISPQFCAVLLIYYVVTFAYSVKLKRVLLLDVYILSTLYVIRVVAGGIATGVHASPWLLAFCVFFFLSLALVKRLSELQQAAHLGASQLPGRSYAPTDVFTIGSLLAGSSFTSTAVLALYINTPQVRALYHTPSLLWSLCLMTSYWLSRMYVLAWRGQVSADPVLFAIRDRVSHWLAAIVVVILVVSSRFYFRIQ